MKRTFLETTKRPSGCQIRPSKASANNMYFLCLSLFHCYLEFPAGTVHPLEGFRKKTKFPTSSQPEKREYFDFNQWLGVYIYILYIYVYIYICIDLTMRNKTVFYSNTLYDIVPWIKQV